ncbi:MAG: outer membrane protein assembly factor BamA [Phycisphaerales bacterium]
MALLLASGAAMGQQAEPPARPPQPSGVSEELAPFEGRPVRSIQLRRPGDDKGGTPIDEATRQLAMNQLRLREGAPFSSALVSEDVARLNRLGRFRRVESRVQQLSDGSVELSYVLSQQAIIEDVQSVGNRKLSDEDIQAIAGFLVQTPVDQVQLDRACRRVEAAYREKGFYNCRVTVAEKELNESNVALFQVREGEKTKVTDIRFEGNLSYSAGELKSELETREAFLFLSAPLEDAILDSDVAALLQFYKDRGRLDIRCDRIVTPSANGKEAIVSFVLEEGPVYTMRDVRISFDRDDERAFAPEQLMGLMSIKAGDVYSDDKLRKSMQLIEGAYGKLGYTDVKVVRREMRDPAQPLVDVLLVVSEGRRWRTGEVKVSGNVETRDAVVRRQITLRPDRPLDKTEVAETERRLRTTRLFAPDPAPKVTIQPEDPENPGYRDVLVQVEETNTGNFSFGGTIGTDNGVGASISLNQRNFDLYDVPKSLDEITGGGAFRGGGQTFQILIAPGDRVRNFSIGLTDPYMFETDYSGSARAYFRQRLYRSYTEERYGAGFSVGRRFGSRWSMNVPLRLENVTLDEIDSDAPVDYFAEEDSQVLSSIGFTLARQTLDDQFRPGKGSRTEFGIEEVVVGGESFQKLSAERAGYFKLREDFYGRKTVLQLKTRAEYIPQDQDQVPFFERYYMGGSGFRGFRYRGVSPVGIRNDNGQIGDDPVGGRFLFFAGAEVQHPVYEDIVAVVAFIDSGTVSEEVTFNEYRVSVGVGVRLTVAALSPAPLAFDFGIPLMKEETDELQVFSFSLDIPFR